MSGVSNINSPKFRAACRLAMCLLFASVGNVSHSQEVTAVYPPVNDATLREIQDEWKQGRVLEGMGTFIGRVFRFEKSLRLVGAECKQANAFYVPNQQAIVLCLELVPHVVDALIKERGRRATREELAFGTAGVLGFVLFHELGHAVVDLFQIPVLGRQEDAADQISTYLMLQDPQFADHGVNGALFFFRENKWFYGQRHLADEHGLNPQRRVNIACWAYGKDPERFAWALKAARVTANRAARCQAEYGELERSVRSLLGQHMR